MASPPTVIQASASVSLRITTSAGNYVQPDGPQFSPTPTFANGFNGPAPGCIAIHTTPGTDISFAQLSALGGLCWLKNLDTVNYVTYGKWDGVNFHPLGELLPGEKYLLRLARNLLSGGETLRFIATNAGPGTAALFVNVIIDGFDA